MTQQHGFQCWISIEATLTLSRNPFTAGLAAARQQAERFARDKVELSIVPKLEQASLQKIRTQIEKVSGKALVKANLDNASLAAIKTRIERTVGRVNVRAQFEAASLSAIKARIDKTIGRVNVRATFDSASLAAIKQRIDRTIGRINVRAQLDAESLARIKSRVDRMIGRMTVRLDLDRTSLAAIRARIERMRPTITVRLNNIDRTALDRVSGSLRQVREAADGAGRGLANAGDQGAQSFRHMDGTVRAVLMGLPLLLPVAASAVTGLVGALGGVVSILGIAGVGLAAFGGVAVAIWSKVTDGAKLTRAEIAALPPGIREASGALKTLQETWNALVARTQTGVGQAMAAGFNAATAAVRTLDPIINAMSATLVRIGQDIEQYFGTAHWQNFVSFIAGAVGPTFTKLWDIVKLLTRGVMDLIIAFNPLAQWMLDKIVAGMQGFAKWTSTLAGNPQFQQWLELVKQSLSAVFSFLGSVVEFIFKLSNALAPFGNVILKVLTMIFEGLNKLPPEWLAAIAVGLTAIFAALLLGAGGPVAIVVGVLFGLAAAFASAYQNSETFRNGIDGLAATLSSRLAPTLAVIYDAIETKIKPAWDALTAAVRDNFLPVLQNLWMQFQDKVLPAMQGVAETLFSKLIPAFLEFFTAIQPGLAWLVNILGTVFIFIWEQVVQKFDGALKIITGILQLFTALFTGNWQKFWEGIKNIGEGILQIFLSTFGISLDEFYSTLSSWGTNITNMWNSIWSGVGNFFITVWNGITSFITTTIPNAWASLVSGAGSAVDAVIGFFARLPENIGFALGFVIGSIIQWGIDVYIAVTTGFQATLDWFATLPGRIQSFFINVGVWLITTGYQLVEGLRVGILNAFINVVAFFVGLPAAIGNFFTNAGIWLLVHGVSLLTGLLNGALQGWASVTAFFAGLPAAIGSFFAGAGTWLLQVGIDILLGLINGLNSAFVTVSTWIANFVSGFINGFKAALGISSPSTIFAQIGVDILLGLINGLNSMMASVVAFFVNLIAQCTAIFNQIVAIVAGVMAQVSALWAQAWATILASAQQIWNAIQAAWLACLAGARASLEVFIAFVSGAWSAFWESVRAVGQAIWTSIQIAWAALLTAMRQIYDAFAALLSGNWQGFWTGIQNAAQTIWNGIQAAWQNFITSVTNIYNAFASYMSNAWTAFWNSIRAIAESVWSIVANSWNVFISAITNAYNAFSTFLTGSWTAFWNGIRQIAEVVWNAIYSFIENRLIALRDTVGRAADQIGAIWRKVANFFRDPVQWVIDVVINRGILAGWNTVMGWIGAPGLAVQPLGGLPTFEKGGEVKKGRHGVANRDSVPSLTMPGEYVFSKPAIANMGGLSAVDQIHQMARMGTNMMSPLAGLHEGQTAQALMRSIPKMDDIMKFAYGGVQPHVAAAGEAVTRALGPMPGGIGGVGSRPGPSDHPSGLALDFMSMGNVGLGHRVADFLTRGWGQHAVKYLIWQQRIANSPGAWSGMENRGSVTANHFDHVHASFLGEGGAGGGGGLGSIMVSLWSILSGQVEGLFNKLLNFGGMPGNGSLIGNAITEIPKNIIKKVIDSLRTKLEGMFTAGASGGPGSSGPAGPAVERWRPLVEQALRHVGQPINPAIVARVLNQIRSESGGDPNAQNNWDINAIRGDPSVGLLQVIESTFQAHRDRTLPNNRRDPFANIVASMRYALSRYGSLERAYRGVGYDNGGWMMPGVEPIASVNKTRKPEAVLTDEQWTGVLNGLANLTDGQVIGSRDSTNEVMISGIEQLGRVMTEIRDLLADAGLGNIIVEDKSGDPKQTAREALLQMRLR